MIKDTIIRINTTFIAEAKNSPKMLADMAAMEKLYPQYPSDVKYMGELCDKAFMLASNTRPDLENIESIGGGWTGEEALAIAFFTLLDQEYEQAPVPRQLCIAADVDLNDPQDAQRIYDYAYWLYWRSYLLRPSSQAVMARAMPRAHAIIARAGESDARPLLQELNEQLMSSEPAGPIPLTTAQWLRLIIDDEMP